MANSISNHNLDERGGRIDTVLVLTGEDTSALASLLSQLDSLPVESLAPNHRESLYALRKTTFGY